MALIDKLRTAVDDSLSYLYEHAQELEDEIDQNNVSINHLEKQVNDLKEKVDELEDENKNLMEYIDELKIDLLKAQKLIDEGEHKTLNTMYFAAPEDRVVAKEVINNLYKE